MRGELVLACGEFLDLRATRGRVLGDARATFLNLPLLLQLAGDRLLETATSSRRLSVSPETWAIDCESSKSSAWAMRKLLSA